MFSHRTFSLTRHLGTRNIKRLLPLALIKTMPFTELALPKLKAGPEIKAAFAAEWPASAKLLASQSALIRGFYGSIIRENDISIPSEENKPILVLEWTDEAAFTTFLSSEDFAAFAGRMKPLAASPAELQLFKTDFAPLDVMSAPLAEIIRIQVKDDAGSATTTCDAWAMFVKAIGNTAPLTSGKSLNLSESVFMGAIGWESLKVRASTLESLTTNTATSRLRDLGKCSSILIEVEPFKTA